MRDRLQIEASRFCARFGLAPIVIQFTEAFTSADIKIFNFLARPDKELKDLPGANALFKRLELLPAEAAEEARAAAKKDFLWKEYTSIPSRAEAIARIEAENVRILKAAIKICEGRMPEKYIKALPQARAVADKIRQFHVQGKVIQEIKNLTDKLSNERGKMPLFETGAEDFEIFVHETIHYILIENRIYANYNPFDEGLCTYLHLRFRKSLRAYLSMYLFGGRRDYLRWSKYFAEQFSKVPDGEIGRLLSRQNLQRYYYGFRKRFG